MADTHIINHTHWDREWFLTHEYTTAWIPSLIDSLERLAAANPDYEYLFDGQSLVIEDLLATRPEYRDRVATLVGKGVLSIGPLYSQPDWRMVSGELHLRNLEYGIGDAESFGGRADVAWLVDTFGHISQVPQMLRHAGIDAVYVWRGVPQMTPQFTWVGPDDSEVQAINLFGGYRNLYGITKTAEIAVDRLVGEVDKLSGEYGDLPIPLFDGYDLDCEPEDPASYYRDLPVPDRVSIVASSPRTYAEAVRPHLDGAPRIVGELLSGKYGSTFPGSLSSRTYLKVLHHDAEVAMHRRVEPLAALAAATGVQEWDGAEYEARSRELLRNAVHDCLCGVSVDQVHERMERSYRDILAFADRRQRELATSLLSGFAPGNYAVSTGAVPVDRVVRVDGGAVRVTTNGVGVAPLGDVAPVAVVDEITDRFRFANDHHVVCWDDEQGLTVDGRAMAQLAVVADRGDTYSSEPGETLGLLTPSGPAVVADRSDLDQTLRVDLGWENDEIAVRATVEVRLDDGPLIEFAIAVDSDGTGFRVDARFDTGVAAPTVHASMPFDVVERPHDDDDLFGPEVAPELAAILMGQRETGRITEYPFHDFVALSTEERTAAVMAKGLRSCRTGADGTIVVTLRRAAEWLALTGLSLRSGDAGPMMYVPMARCERRVEHRLAYCSRPGPLNRSGLIELSDGFHNPPLVARVDGDGHADTDSAAAPVGASVWEVLTAPVSLQGLRLADDATVEARLWNPADATVELAKPLRLRSMRNDDLGTVERLEPKQFVTAVIDVAALPEGRADGRGTVDVLTPIVDRGGRSRSTPSEPNMGVLRDRIDELEGELAAAIGEVAEASGSSRWLLTHRQYVIERELLELKLSAELNERLASSTAEVSIPDDADPVIADLGLRLNDLRIRRRIYDYVVQTVGQS
jgi:alpha-mannosidase